MPKISHFTLIYENGDKYSGEIDPEGRKNGKGTYSNAAGKIIGILDSDEVREGEVSYKKGGEISIMHNDELNAMQEAGFW